MRLPTGFARLAILAAIAIVLTQGAFAQTKPQRISIGERPKLMLWVGHSYFFRRANMRPVLFMTWPYKDKPEMLSTVAQQYTIAGNASDALVIPAGLAFANASSRDPSVDLYHRDKRHPSMAGTYLAACTSYAALVGKTPEGASYTAGLPPETAKFLQKVAWDTVRDYYSR